MLGFFFKNLLCQTYGNNPLIYNEVIHNILEFDIIEL
jgi:hypothetical protein